MVGHLGQGHLFTAGSFATATRNALDAGHPLKALLWPHVFGTLDVNNLLAPMLVGEQPGTGVVGDCFNIEHKELWRVLGDATKSFDLRQQDPREHRRARGCDDGALAEPTVEDAVLLWDMMVDYTREYLDAIWDSDVAAAGDAQLVRFLKALEQLVPNGMRQVVGDLASLARRAPSYPSSSRSEIWTASVWHRVVGTLGWHFQSWPRYVPSQVYEAGGLPPADVLPALFQRADDDERRLAAAARRLEPHRRQQHARGGGYAALSVPVEGAASRDGARGRGPFRPGLPRGSERGHRRLTPPPRAGQDLGDLGGARGRPPRRWLPSPLRGALEGGDVELHHPAHRREHPRRHRAVLVREEAREDRGDNLPGDTPAIAEPAAPDLRAAVRGQRAPEAVHLGLVGALDRDRRGGPVVDARAAVERLERLPAEREVDDDARHRPRPRARGRATASRARSASPRPARHSGAPPARRPSRTRDRSSRSPCDSLPRAVSRSREHTARPARRATGS